MSEQLKLAVKAMLTGNVSDPNLVAAPVPKGKGEVKTLVMKLDEGFPVYFDDAQSTAVADFYTGMIDAIGSYDSARRACYLALHAAFPKGLTYNQWQLFGKSARAMDDARKDEADKSTSGSYLYQQSCIAVRMMKAHGAVWKKGTLESLGELPAKGGGTKSGKRTPSPSKWNKTLVSDCQTLRKHIAQLSKLRNYVEPATLKQVTVILKSLDAALAKAARVKVA